MRLWHQDLIQLIDRERLLGQHRECCALRGNGWGRKHSIVDYVFTYPPEHLFMYHALIMREMIRRGYTPSIEWISPLYRGKSCEPWEEFNQELFESLKGKMVFPEHDEKYLEECLLNLREKGVNI